MSLLSSTRRIFTVFAVPQSVYRQERGRGLEDAIELRFTPRKMTDFGSFCSRQITALAQRASLLRTLVTAPSRGPSGGGFRGLVLSLSFVPGDHAVFDEDHAVGVFGDVVFVGDQHDGIAFRLQAIEQRHDLVAGLRVEVAG